MDVTIIQRIVAFAVPLLFAITLHEVSHGYAARRLGDATAHMLGRLSLNPIKHIDPVGTVVLPVLLLLGAMLAGAPPFVFGWAKPVPVNWENLRNPDRDMALVAAAGPMANLVMAVFWGIVARIGFSLEASWSAAAIPLEQIGVAGVMINIVLMVLNLLPIPPLDGSRIVTAALPGPMALRYNQLEPYGLLILLVLLVTGVLGTILWPPVVVLVQFVKGLVGLPTLGGI